MMGATLRQALNSRFKDRRINVCMSRLMDYTEARHATRDPIPFSFNVLYVCCDGPVTN